MDGVKIECCRLCDGDLRLVHNFGETALANEFVGSESEADNQDHFPLHLVQCKACGHVQLDFAVSPARMFSKYAYTSGTTQTFRKHLKQLAGLILSEFKGASVLEIGSNDGTLLSHLDGKHRVLGVDPASNIVARNTINAFWSEETAKKIVKRQGRFDLAVALNVFAHVFDIRGFTKGVYSVLKNHGVFLFEVGYLHSMVHGGHYDVIYHEHLDYHSIRALRPFLRRHGLPMTRWQRMSSQGGSIRGYAAKSSVDTSVFPDDEELDMVGFSQRIKAHGNRLKNLAAGVDGGFGAPAKLTTLMHNAGLTRKQIPVIYDDNPLKVDKFTPGTGIPIRPTSEIKDGSKLLLFSWNFADEIRKRFPRCEFVVPFKE